MDRGLGRLSSLLFIPCDTYDSGGEQEVEPTVISTTDSLVVSQDDLPPSLRTRTLCEVMESIGKVVVWLNIKPQTE